MPVLLAQAAYLRRNVITLPDPEGDRKGTIGAGPPLRLLVIGDSSALGIGTETLDDALIGQIAQRLAPHCTVSFELVAKSGARTWDVVGWLDEMPEGGFDVVVTALGVNDVTKLVSLHKFLRGQSALIAGLRTRFDDPFVIVSGLPPVEQFPLLPHPVRWVLGRQAARFDRRLRALVDTLPNSANVRIDLGLGPHNMAEDGFHPGPEVYAEWAKEVVALIRARTDLLDGLRAKA
ncbi:SGNH/GDSL hydrolase family protein [Loktanella sp. Alg231-35]|uniref:SGNH/GDSL hydrolase family protein n=1 Tax=Loktanella sp. Alg231-35 TaxID=1922220 RepID=UPI00131F3C7D|nr:SGNH/GDSL hydrolase family protein [Loktanella sp. Alg231-35]